VKSFLIWFLAIIITLAAAYYQRTTGPTYPKKVSFTVDKTTHKIKFKRSEGEKDCAIELPLAFKDKVKLHFIWFKVNESYQTLDFIENENGGIVAFLPQQPPAGKLQYYITYIDNNKEVRLNGSEDVVIRFKGDVPAAVLIPHVFFMFFAMLFSNLTGLMVVFKKSDIKKYLLITFFLILAGGMIMGPIVQKYAFGEFWTGVPFGWDLTDNKTLIAFVFWIIALVSNYRKPRPGLVLLASIVTIIIFSVPHSMFGSELNYNTGVISQG